MFLSHYFRVRVLGTVETTSTLVLNLCWGLGWSELRVMTWNRIGLTLDVYLILWLMIRVFVRWRVLFGLNLGYHFGMRLSVSLSAMILWRVKHVFESFSLWVTSCIAPIISHRSAVLDFDCCCNFLVLRKWRDIGRRPMMVWNDFSLANRLNHIKYFLFLFLVGNHVHLIVSAAVPTTYLLLWRHVIRVMQQKHVPIWWSWLRTRLP